MYGVQTWHDETFRWEKTGHLDQGGCWCEDCLLEASKVSVDYQKEFLGEWPVDDGE